ncbi:MAG: hypothetical protein E7167_00520 [Firmicutes bacterium]|nr:hypothetical protein [Bacillota bacterium]
MDELIETIASFPRDEGIRYFYHITSATAEELLEQGIIVANPRWQQSFLEFTDEELDDASLVIDENKSTLAKQNNTIIIAAVYEDEMDRFIRPIMEGEVSTVDWEGVGAPNYIVDPFHILGYIDIESLSFTFNSQANVDFSYYRI